MEPIAPGHYARELWLDSMSQLRALITGREVHPSRTVVLVPYAQLMPLARQAWAAVAPTGFAPRFETTMNWAGASASFEPAADDISFDMGRDLLVARVWLGRAGLAPRADALSGRLVEVAWQLAGVAAAVLPAQRTQWAQAMRATVCAGAESPWLALEAAVAGIGLAWAGASAYATDALLQPPQAHAPEPELLVVLEGLQTDPLTQALQRAFAGRCVALPLDHPRDAGTLALHEATDPSHEAEMTAACVVRQVDAGRAPVALAAIDRVLTRRVRAMLEARGLSIRDETGWKLSTTRAAAQVMACLRGCAWDAPSDAVIDWLKNTPAAPSRSVSALERRLRREGVRDWRRVGFPAAEGTGADALVRQVNGWRAAMQEARPLPQWLEGLRGLLEAGGQWPHLARDDAGMQLIDALGLAAQAQLLWQSLPHAQGRLRSGEFSAWVNATLEAASFRPAHPPLEQVVILPMSQVLARPFEALVLAGCDEIRLPACPEPPGRWSAAQRTELGLPSRAALEAEQRASWRCALQVPQVDVLWRASDDTGEPVLPSPLVQSLRFDGAAGLAPEPRATRELVPAPVARPLPVAGALPVPTLSASAYDDLRHCPYRFHALRQLGLKEAAEIDGDLGKRDFGNWLHKVLTRFHQTLRDGGGAPDAGQLELAAREVTQEMQLADAEFLPFAAAWPAVRDGYLDWLGRYSAREGGVFANGETEHQRQLGPVTLVGRVDRIDRLPDGRLFVLDYKTESPAKTSDRIEDPAEDTQLAFYAALLQAEDLRAGYVNVGERGETRLVEQRAIGRARELLEEGIRHDLARIAENAVLPALGEGPVCGFCAARGVCRRDFWTS